MVEVLCMILGFFIGFLVFALLVLRRIFKDMEKYGMTVTSHPELDDVILILAEKIKEEKIDNSVR